MRTSISNKNMYWDLLAVVCLFIVSAAAPAVAADAPAMANSASQPMVQTKCPVLGDQDVDPNIYSDYKGKRVYFCCLGCKADFDADPEKYLAKLPQFTGSQADNVAKQPKRPRSWMRKWIEPSGATTLVLLIVTVCLALFRRVRWPKPGLILKLHKVAGVCALCSGLLHATMVLLH